MKSFSENEIVESGVRNPDDIVKSNLEYVSRAQASALERKFSHINIKHLAYAVRMKI